MGQPMETIKTLIAAIADLKGRQLVIAILLIAIVTVCITILSGCGTVNYVPTETTITNKATETPNAKAETIK